MIHKLHTVHDLHIEGQKIPKETQVATIDTELPLDRLVNAIHKGLVLAKLPEATPSSAPLSETDGN